MIFTRATLADLSAIAGLEADGFDHAGWSADAWRAEIEGADRHVVVARTHPDDEVVGVATFQSVYESADLHRVVVRADRRGRGIGAKLVRAGIDWAAAMGAERMLLEVEFDNTAAQRLYDVLGFVPVAERRDYYGAGCHAVVMSLDLMADGADEEESA